MMRVRRSRLRFILTLLASTVVAATLPSPVTATTVIPPTFNQLVERAEVVFEGEVFDTKARLVTNRDGDTIVTDVYFRVARVLKGQAGPTLILTFLGGTIGDRSFGIDGIPRFAVGDHDVLFAAPSQGLASPLIGMMHGRVRIVSDPATKERLVRHFDGTPLREAQALTLRQKAQAFSQAPALSLAAFERAVTAEVTRQRKGAR